MNLYPVIIAGGSGTRFWPLSRKARPKQLLPLVSKRPLIADTAARLKGLAPPSRTYVVCGKLHAAPIRRALPGVPVGNILVEPAARNTGPAIGLAAVMLARRDPSALLAVLPSDQHVADMAAFQAALREAAEVAGRGWLVTLGIRPHRPETGYGYIQRGEPMGGTRAFSVRAFQEKPDVETARSYLSSGDFFWNAGIFVFQAQAMLTAIAEHAPELFAGLDELRQAKASRFSGVLKRVFPKLPSISIDYAVMEKARNIAVVPGDFGWSDVGSFAALPEVRAADDHGNVASGEQALVIDCRDSVVIAGPRPLAVVGMTGVVVVDSGDAILVLPKEQSQDVRKVVEALKARKLERYL